MQPKRSLIFGLIFLLTIGLCPTFLAQSSQPKKKIKDFGSSLKRLQWDPEKQTAVEVTTAAANVDVDDVIRINTTLVTSDVLVLDRQGHNVTGLTAEDFIVTEDGEPQKVSHFLLGDNPNVPRTIVLIIDYSGSQLPYIRTSVEAAKTLVDKLNPRDRMALVTDDVELIEDFTDDKKKLKKKLDSLVDKATRHGGFFGFKERQLGRSDQYSALMATLNEAFDDEDQRPIVVFQTDGDEAYRLRNPIVLPALPPDVAPEISAKAEQGLRDQLEELERLRKSFSLEDLYRTAEKSRATIYTVIPGFRYMGLTPEQQVAQFQVEEEARAAQLVSQLPAERRKAIQKFIGVRKKMMTPANMLFYSERNAKIQSALAMVATLTGGWTDFLEKPSQADEIYSRIFSDINQRYIVGYYPTNKEFDGKRRKIRIEVRGHPDYQISGRKSYYAPGPNNR